MNLKDIIELLKTLDADALEQFKIKLPEIIKVLEGSAETNKKLDDILGNLTGGEIQKEPESANDAILSEDEE